MLTTITKAKVFGTTWGTLLQFTSVGPIQIIATNNGPDPVHIQIERIVDGVTTAIPLVGESTITQILPGDKFVHPLYDSPNLTKVRCRSLGASTITGVVTSQEP